MAALTLRDARDFNFDPKHRDGRRFRSKLLLGVGKSILEIRPKCFVFLDDILIRLLVT